jgi:hypothetical protein
MTLLRYSIHYSVLLHHVHLILHSSTDVTWLIFGRKGSCPLLINNSSRSPQLQGQSNIIHYSPNTRSINRIRLPDDVPQQDRSLFLHIPAVLGNAICEYALTEHLAIQINVNAAEGDLNTNALMIDHTPPPRRLTADSRFYDD